VVEERPDEQALRKMVRVRKPVSVVFEDDGIVPNNPRMPFVVYRGAVDLKKRNGFDPGTVVDALFEQNGWRVAAAIDCTIRNCRPRSAALEVGSRSAFPTSSRS
jgi:hypothetical protein